MTVISDSEIQFVSIIICQFSVVWLMDDAEASARTQPIEFS